jgi:hypothetical protein
MARLKAIELRKALAIERIEAKLDAICRKIGINLNEFENVLIADVEQGQSLEEIHPVGVIEDVPPADGENAPTEEAVPDSPKSRKNK